MLKEQEKYIFTVNFLLYFEPFEYFKPIRWHSPSLLLTNFKINLQKLLKMYIHFLSDDYHLEFWCYISDRVGAHSSQHHQSDEYLIWHLW